MSVEELFAEVVLEAGFEENCGACTSHVIKNSEINRVGFDVYGQKIVNLTMFLITFQKHISLVQNIIELIKVELCCFFIIIQGTSMTWKVM